MKEGGDVLELTVHLCLFVVRIYLKGKKRRR
jgi:hypothetical protein